MTEIWKDVPGFEGLYEVSSHGRLRSLGRPVLTGNGQLRRYRERTLVTPLTAAGYPHAHLRRGTSGGQTVLVHHLVAAAFIGPRPDGADVRHLNCIPADNRVENLAYGSRIENLQDSVALGRMCHGESRPAAKLSDDAVRLMRALHAAGLATHRSLAENFGVSPSVAGRAVAGHTWKHVS